MASAFKATLPKAKTDYAAIAVGVHATCEVVAQSKSVTVRMLVTVTDDSIHLFALSATGSEPGREVTTSAADSVSLRCQEIGLTGSAAFFSSYADADNSVLAALSGG